jgi:UPF0755 protein
MWSKYNLAMKKIKHRKIIVFFAFVTAIAICAGIYMLGIQSSITENIFYRIQPGEAISTVARDMRQKNIIANESLFVASSIFQGNRIQSGEYELPRGASITKIAGMFNRGKIASVRVLIPEGMTVKQIESLLMATPTLSGEITMHYNDGELFPDTYHVPRGISRDSVLDLMKKKMDAIRLGWDNSGRAMPKPLKDWNRVITLASIIQKETPRVSEMPIVASVYLNRLRTRMRLQADPTVVYAITDGLGDMQGGALYTSHLQTPHPFNTYTNYGLPPRPIANVGRHAIARVLNPADTTYLYFVADGTGGHKFARSYAEHQKNHANWREIRDKKE